MDKTGSIVHDDIPGVSGCLLFTGIYWGNPSPGVSSIGAEYAPYSQIVFYTGRMRPIVENDVTIHPSWTILELETSYCHMFQ